MTGAHQLALPGVVAEQAIEWVWAEDTEGDADVTFEHTTVMRDEVVHALAPRAGGVYLDATLGGGGHTEAILAAAPGTRVIAFDRDEVAAKAARERLLPFGERVTIVRANFGSVQDALGQLGVASVQGLCADLGVSSPQLDDPERGMSFRREGPIDMRMDRDSGETALELIERVDDEALADIIFRYGDERRSRRIARSIKRALADDELATTLDLRRAIVRAVGPVRVGGVDPATRTFQALRIAVNRELEELEALLAALPAIVEAGGVAAILSFHSLEDRQVKQAFHESSIWEPLWKKPLGASDEERSMNVRSRSAKLRAARRREAVEGDEGARSR
jgi:16S rRNA (cytosine1402-N4)-methyltransferase